MRRLDVRRLDVRGRANRLWAILAVLVTTASAACGDGATEPGEPLSPREAEALLLGMMALVGDTAPNVVSGTLFDGVLACPLAGQVTRTFTSTLEMSGDTTRTTVEFTLDPDGCSLSSEGWEFTVDGNPEFRVEMTISGTGTDLEFRMEGTVGGAVDWELDDRWGTCAFDMSFSGGAVQNFAEPQLFGERTGTVCGVDVERLDPGPGAALEGG